MRRALARFVEYAIVAALLSLATAFVTWPHARFFGGYVIRHIDPLFSMWRLAWFARAAGGGGDFLNGNIFYPEPATLLLSDAVFLQGALAAPALWIGVPITIVYNTLMLAGVVSSGLALYYLTTSSGVGRCASFVGATIFCLAPYRIEHAMHLELQWVAPAVLAFAALYRLLYTPRWTSGAALGLCAALQFLACVYYAVFLIPLMVALVVVALPRAPHPRRTILYGVLAAVIAAALALPIARLYMAQGERVGERSLGDLVTYSATAINYFASPPENTLYGATSEILGSGERRLFPGLVAFALGVAGLFSPRRRLVIAAATVVVLAFDLSLGVNGLSYPILYRVWPTLHGLRAPARFAIFGLGALALLAALGVEELVKRLPQRPRVEWGVALLLVLIACVEYRSPLSELARTDMDPPVYRFLRQLPAGVVLEWPFSAPKRPGLPDLDADYIFWSTHHWHPMLNGYSGYYPPSYDRTRERLDRFPDENSRDLLTERDVRYVLVHETYIPARERSRLLGTLVGSRYFLPLGTYRDWAGPTHVFEYRGGSPPR